MLFVKRGEALVTPCRCLCQEHVGPFVDTGVELAGYGRVYLCGKCVVETGRLFGMLDEEQAERLREETVAAVGRAEEADRQALANDDRRTVSLRELRQLVTGAVTAGFQPATAEPEAEEVDRVRVKRGRRS